MVNIRCLLLGHKGQSSNNPVTSKLTCKRCNAVIKKSKRKKQKVRYCIKEIKKNQYLATCNIPGVTGTGVSFQQAHNRLVENLGNHFNSDPEKDISFIRDMKIK